MTPETEQLIRSIEQQLENLMLLDGDLSLYYENELYYADKIDEPIVEKFTPELLKELEDLVFNFDNDQISS